VRGAIEREKVTQPQGGANDGDLARVCKIAREELDLD